YSSRCLLIGVRFVVFRLFGSVHLFERYFADAAIRLVTDVKGSFLLIVSDPGWPVIPGLLPEVAVHITPWFVIDAGAASADEGRYTVFWGEDTDGMIHLVSKIEIIFISLPSLCVCRVFYKYPLVGIAEADGRAHAVFIAFAPELTTYQIG